MTDERTGAGLDETPAVSHATKEYDPQPYLKALDVLQRNAKRNLTICRVVIVIMFLLLAPWAILQILQKGDMFALYIIGFVLVIESIPALFPNLLMGGWTSKFGEQFPQSGLAERIALGELDKDDPIYGHTPWPLRWLIPRNTSGNPLVTLGRVAGSLPWYLASPRVHVKQTWGMAFSFLPFLVMFLPQMLMTNPLGGSNLTFPLIMIGLFVPGVLIGMVVLNHVMVGMLAEFLRIVWNEPQPTKEITSDEVGRKAKMQLMLNQVQQDLEKALAIMIFPVLVPFVLGTFPIMTSSILTRGFVPIVLFMVLFTALIFFVFNWLPKHGFSAYRKGLQGQLEDSRIYMLIASGELDSDGLIEHTPWVFRFIHNTKQMPKGFADNLRLLIWRAGLNLDWFLEKPRTLLRPSWITDILLAFIGLGSMVFVVMSPFRAIHSLSSSAPIPTMAEMFAVGNIKWILFSAILILAVPGVIHATKTRIWVEELILHLRARLAG